jgi:hypothetical protein
MEIVMSIQNGSERGLDQKAIEAPLEVVRHALAGLRFGSVEIVVHDSKVVQVERKEKVRLVSDAPKR